MRSADVEAICGVLHEFARSDLEWPASFVLTDSAGRRVDCHPLDFDEHGDGWQSRKSGGQPYCWPRDGLTGVGKIGELEVPCITPELQVRWHLYPEFDDLDWQDLQHLSRRFGLKLPEGQRELPGFLAPKRGAQP